MSNPCQGFCTLCGTSCADYFRDYRELREDLEDIEDAVKALLEEKDEEITRMRAALERIATAENPVTGA